MKTTIFLIAIGLTICVSFSKPPAPLTDYRDSYVGNYSCASKCQALNSEQTAIAINTSTVTITIAKNATDSILDISINATIYQAKLKNSILYSSPNTGHWSGKFFSTDSFSFISSRGHAPNTCAYKGKKN